MTRRFSALMILGLGAAIIVAGCNNGPKGPASGMDSGASQPDSAQPDSAQPDSAQPDSAQPDSARTDSARTDGAADGLGTADATSDRSPGAEPSPDLRPDQSREVRQDTSLADSGDATKDAQSSPDAGTVADTGGGPGSVQLMGRFDFTDSARPGFGWSGSAMIARFQGTGATLRIDGSPNQFAVLVDGVLSPVLKVVSGTTQYALASGLASGSHDLVVWKRTEGNQGENRFLGIDVAGGQLLAPPAAPDRRIEIYGDSITAGYGLDGQGPNCSFSQDTEDHYLTYGALSARALSAELHTVAWSGIGMYRNYGESGASADAMPAVYARTLPTQTDSVWSFDSWQPDAVVINLGTNDASTSGDPGTPFRTAYLDFVRTLRQKYPATQFVLTIGPMLSGDSLTAIEGHLQAVIQTRQSEGDSKLAFLEFPVQTGSDGYGCDWHPNAATNAQMATLLTAELKTLLGW